MDNGQMALISDRDRAERRESSDADHGRNVTDKADQDDLEILPQWLDQDLWIEFIKHRRDMAPPARRARCFTARAQRMTVRKLAEIQQAGFDPNDSLKQSIERGWIGVFPCDAIRKAKGTTELRSYQNPKDPVRMKLHASNRNARAEQLGIEKFKEGAETRQHFEHRVAMAEMHKMRGKNHESD